MEELNIIYRNNGKTIVEDKYKKTYIMEEDNHAVVILARYLNSFIFVKQFRRAVNDDVIQLPGGKVEKGEELEEAARREFLEEAGAQCGNMDYLGSLVPASWISNVVTHVFYTQRLY